MPENVNDGHVWNYTGKGVVSPMDEEAALAWGQDYADPCSPNPLIAIASGVALLIGGVFFLLGLGVFMVLDQGKLLLGAKNRQ